MLDGETGNILAMWIQGNGMGERDCVPVPHPLNTHALCLLLCIITTHNHALLSIAQRMVFFVVDRQPVVAVRVHASPPWRCPRGGITYMCVNVLQQRYNSRSSNTC